MQEVGLDLPTESQKEPDGPRPSSAVTRAQVVPEGWLEGAAWRPVGAALIWCEAGSRRPRAPRTAYFK